MTTWDNDAVDLQFRRRAQMQRDAADSGAWARLWVGLGAFALIALAYPLYEYRVQAALLERDLQQATAQIQGQAQAAGDALNRELLRQRAATERMTRDQRMAAVRVMGVSDSGGVPNVMVVLQGLSATEAAGPICTQAQRWLQRRVSGQTLRVQAARGDRPAQDAGTIRCN